MKYGFIGCGNGISVWNYDRFRFLSEAGGKRAKKDHSGDPLRTDSHSAVHVYEPLANASQNASDHSELLCCMHGSSNIANQLYFNFL